MNAIKNQFHKFIILVSFTFITLQSMSQGYLAPSPDAHGLAKITNIPVNHYAGMAGINIPIYQLPSKQLSVSVSLNYNATGIKVQEVASSQGLGWNLNAGGLITRVVRGIPDDIADGFCKPNRVDKEPDLFYFSFLGRSGKFVLDANGYPALIPYQSINIAPGVCSSSTGIWEITDENGILYRFGKTASERETTTTKLVGQTTNQWIYTSSWYLSEVISPNGTDKLTFSYSQATISYTNYFFTKYEYCNSDLSLKDESTISTINQKLISSITSSMGTIIFSWRYGREDLTGGYMLDAILLYDKNVQQINKIKFQYSYFKSSVSCSTELCKRLRLDFIYDQAFDPLYSFNYNTIENLPPRNSKNFDHWGYYNNNTYDSWLPNVPTSPFFLPGASREPDELKMSANTIRNIGYRGGGSKHFFFEGHRVSANELVGGLRIKMIATHDGKGNCIRTIYNYNIDGSSSSSGILFYRPEYMLVLVNDRNNEVVTARRYSSSYAQLLDVNGYHVGYSRVEEVNEGKFEGLPYPEDTGLSLVQEPGDLQGKIVYNFANWDKIPDANIDNKPPFGSSTSKSWQRGNPESISVYDQNGNLLSRQLTEYNYTLPTIKSVTGRKEVGINYACNGSSGSSTRSVEYYMVSSPINVKKETKETYDPSNSTKKNSVATEFEYSTLNYLPIKAITYDLVQPTKKYISQVRYPTHADYDFCTQQYQDCMATCDPITEQVCMNNCDAQRYNCDTNGAGTGEITAILKLKKRNQIATPIETVKLYTDGTSTKVLSSSVNVFSLEGTGFSQVNLKEVWTMSQVVDESAFTYSKTLVSGTFQFDTRMRKVQTNNSYDATTGNLLQQTSLNGIQTNYIWDANNMPISQTVSGGVNSRTTNTTYKLMVGPTTATDANGVVSKKEYDIYNRVSVIKDFQDNILARYRYHYKNEKPNFAIAPQITETLVNTNLSFYVTDIASSIGGTPTFLWDFGDGTTITNGSTSVSHTYTSAGTYTLKLVGMNPEYGATTRTLQIGVYNPLSVSVCADGPVYVDICGTNPPAYGSCTSVQDPNSSTQLTATISGGCASSYQYYWEYRNSASTVWTFLGSAQTVNFSAFSSVEASFEIRCTVTDGCYNQIAASENVTYYKSNPSCPGDIR